MQVPRHIEVKPLVTSKARLETAEVWDGTNKNSTRTEQARDFGDGSLGIGHMFEDVPHDHGIKAGRLKLEPADVTNGHWQVQRGPRMGGRFFAKLGSENIPAARAKFPQQESGPTPNVEHLSLSAKHFMDCGSAATVQCALQALNERRKSFGSAAII